MFYDNADRTATEDGQKLEIYRRAGVGDDYISLYVNKDREGLIGFRWKLRNTLLRLQDAGCRL